MAWNDDDVERWLSDFPLPQDLTWRGERVWPRYALRAGYGQWLRTAGSYHAALRGLFRLVAEILKAKPVGAPMPTPEELAAELRAYEAVQGTLGVEDDADAPLKTTVADAIGGAAIERLDEIGRGMARAREERDQHTAGEQPAA